ncbi:hypothetical protein GRJ2_000456600 [Grus japonensis]|uniref:Uncharacterized protein n=1 Tax=Grus japonensis TaxID=30415 RepID=A0ABC9W317_GRUJA
MSARVNRLLAKLRLHQGVGFCYACWKYNAVERKTSRRFLECVEDNFLTQLVSEPTREGALLDLLFANREGLVGDVMVGGRLGHSSHEMMRVFDSQRSKEAGQQNCHLGLQEGRLWPVWETGWQSPLGGRPEGQRSPGRLDILQEGNLKGTAAGCPHVLKDGQRGRRPAWLNRELWLEVRKKRVYDLWKKGQATQEDYKDVVRL